MASDSLATAATPRPVHKFIAPPDPHSCNAPQAGAERTTVTTAIFDSIAADTSTARLPHFATEHYRDSVSVDRLAAQVNACTPAIFHPSGGATGVAPYALKQYPPGGSALAALLVGTMVATALCGKALTKALKTYRNNLITYRRRNNAFDDSGRVPLSVTVLLALLFIVFGGTALYLGVGYPQAPSFAGAATVMTIVGVYYVLQMLAYNLIGYAFSTPIGRRQWVEGFQASQAFGGILLIAPALLLLCMPQWRVGLAATAATVYIASRIVFISKGVRIYYHGLPSLVYFLLYLACVEIIPPLLILTLLHHLIAY